MDQKPPLGILSKNLATPVCILIQRSQTFISLGLGHRRLEEARCVFCIPALGSLHHWDFTRNLLNLGLIVAGKALFVVRLIDL